MMQTSRERRASAPSPLDLPTFLPYACAQLGAPFPVRVTVETQEEYVSPADDKGKKAVGKAKSAAHASHSRMRTSSERVTVEESNSRPADGEDEVLVVAVLDAAARLVGLTLACAAVPRLLLQVLALIVPLQPHLERLTVRAASLPGAALYELGKLLPLSRLTEVVLDDSPVPERNYDTLLAHERLRRLSLARCELGDEACALVAAALQHPRPAARDLRSLGLACNAIGDAGAAALGEALRSNRALRHLDLAGNRVTDEGASTLFRSLAEFPLTDEELVTQRRRAVEYLRLRGEVYRRCLAEVTQAAADGAAAEEGARGGKRRGPRLKSLIYSTSSACSEADVLAMRADAMVTELLGAHTDPFGPEETDSRDGCVYSPGNMSLCYLNLAHNELSYPAAAALARTLRHQAAARRAGPGLLRVRLDGNPLPAACAELDAAHDLLDQAVLWKLAKPVKKVDKVDKSRSRHK